MSSTLNNESKTHTYFPGLNGLRFIAASLVLITHADAKLPHPHTNDGTPWAHFFINNGASAVNFFFVLSGFLITHLLLEEQRNSGNINIKNFYLKRIVRIWPIYYWVMILTLFILPTIFIYALNIPFKTPEWQQAALCAAMLPNIAFALGDMGKLFHLWTIGVEEQFYMVWPWVMRHFQKFLIPLCVGLILCKMLFFGLAEQHVSTFWYKVINGMGFEKMAMGALGGWFWFHKKEKIKSFPIWGTFAQMTILSILIIAISLSSKVLSDWPILSSVHVFLFGGMLGIYIIKPILFLYLILNISTNTKAIFKGDTPILRYLGDISYGLYVYHMLAVYMSINLVKSIPQGWMQETSFYAVAFATDIALAAFSFRYFESWFMKFRPRKEF